MSELNEGLEYAQMLEIPVNTVNVVKKRSIFPGRRTDELKEKVVDSVNARIGADADGGFVTAEEAEVPAGKAHKKITPSGIVLACETAAVCALAAGIFLTNLFVSDTVINTFVGNLTAIKEKEASYNELTLSSPVSETSSADVSLTDDGVICFTGKTSVYPVCDGEISSVTQEADGYYTVKIAHTSTFCSIVTGLDTVYYSAGDEIKGNLPFAYSQGEQEVRISMYDGETLLDCYTLTGAVPVWNS